MVENQDFKKWGRGRIPGCRELYTSLASDQLNDG